MTEKAPIRTDEDIKTILDKYFPYSGKDDMRNEACYEVSRLIEQAKREILAKMDGWQAQIKANAINEYWDDMRENNQFIMIPKNCIPEGSQLLEAYSYKGELIICGEPDDDHDCDEMGCGTFSHVTLRQSLKEGEPDDKV